MSFSVALTSKDLSIKFCQVSTIPIKMALEKTGQFFFVT